MTDEIYAIQIRIRRHRIRLEVYGAAFAAAEKAVAGIREAVDLPGPSPDGDCSVDRLMAAEDDLEQLRSMYRETLRKVAALERDYQFVQVMEAKP